MFQKFSGYFPGVLTPTDALHAEKFTLPTTLQRYEVVLTSERAMLPAAPASSWVVNAVQPLALEAVPNAAVIMGSGTWPGNPLLNGVAPLPLARLMARLFCAFLNSCRKPFSKIFTSFSFTLSQ